ncbi:ran guanine nucleotide release factor [Ambystoma mexicanum]|uniref:ran guanine nucleotide release factor n=1 Tax=Ambystoma mexicanum TaxID=8296 RepID=UPI0037E79F45
MECNGAQEHMLFGGAFSAVLPPDFQDVSDLREIPDNQEVFAHRWTDQSLIMELLEYQNEVADANAARYHFEDIASVNDASGQERSEVLSVEPIPKGQLALGECQSAWFLTGRQLVSKFNEEARNTVNIYMCLLRLPQFATEVLLTFNDPGAIDPSSSSAESVCLQPTAILDHVSPWSQEHFKVLMQTLQLHNPDIFV